MQHMRPGRCPLAPRIFGLLLIAAAAADGRALLVSARLDYWSVITRAEVELYGGLWLLHGSSSRSARSVASTAILGLSACDLARSALGLPPRYIWGRVAAETGWVLGVDALITLALLRRRPAVGRSAWGDAHPLRLVAAASVALAVGVAIDASGVGQFPIVATSRTGGSASGPGLDHLVYLPEGYHLSSRRWPLILALHGSGDVGRDIDRVRAGGMPRRLEEAARLPFLIVAPQSPHPGWDVGELDALLDEILSRYRIDADHVYLTGLSMGGYGAWAWAAARPERFAAVAPICGGGDPAWATSLRGTPIWAFHGADDGVVPVGESRSMVAAVGAAGGDARLTVFPHLGHDAWTTAYADPELYGWFLAHRRAGSYVIPVGACAELTRVAPCPLAGPPSRSVVPKASAISLTLPPLQ